MGDEIKKFPFDFMQCIEPVGNGSFLRVAGDTFWQQRLAYHSASAGADGKVEYLGLSRPGAGISASGWSIKRISYDSNGNASAIQWALSSLAMARKWDDRTTYVYG